eukprot:6435334-Heterocapsa_arctica.AAC.1
MGTPDGLRHARRSMRRSVMPRSVLVSTGRSQTCWREWNPLACRSKAMWVRPRRWKALMRPPV